jgi:hypothetical protein
VPIQQLLNRLARPRTAVAGGNTTLVQVLCDSDQRIATVPESMNLTEHSGLALVPFEMDAIRPDLPAVWQPADAPAAGLRGLQRASSSRRNECSFEFGDGSQDSSCEDSSGVVAVPFAGARHDGGSALANFALDQNRVEGIAG